MDPCRDSSPEVGEWALQHGGQKTADSATNVQVFILKKIVDISLSLPSVTALFAFRDVQRGRTVTSKEMATVLRQTRGATSPRTADELDYKVPCHSYLVI